MLEPDHLAYRQSCNDYASITNTKTIRPYYMGRPSRYFPPDRNAGSGKVGTLPAGFATCVTQAYGGGYRTGLPTLLLVVLGCPEHKIPSGMGLERLRCLTFGSYHGGGSHLVTDSVNPGKRALLGDSGRVGRPSLEVKAKKHIV